uniref:NADH dehydrogenase subunit 6 n=1 Tax=Zygeupolia rubens TaxID=166045 RepID=I1SR56_9BILA|nr:NADH dehydrogenase subunit 6 [Zygeupolia rubens]ADZ05376.1 NADH dehydrogenase subunit 6 [Zygeupolia rubens]
MFMVFFYGLILGLVFLLPVMQQGVSLIVVIFSLASLMSVCAGLVGFSWYGLSLFLIYVGSLLVMFGYVVAMIPNFLFRQRGVLFVFVVGMVLGVSYCSKFFVVEGPFDIGGFMYSSDGIVIFLGLGVVLFITLVCVVKICYFSKGSLRPFSVYV